MFVDIPPIRLRLPGTAVTREACLSTLERRNYSLHSRTSASALWRVPGVASGAELHPCRSAQGVWPASRRLAKCCVDGSRAMR